jgi:CheY-like chemotaxis protein
VNILLVDDQPENLVALEAILGELGANLVKSTSGKEALRCPASRRFCGHFARRANASNGRL